MELMLEERRKSDGSHTVDHILPQPTPIITATVGKALGHHNLDSTSCCRAKCHISGLRLLRGQNLQSSLR